MESTTDFAVKTGFKVPVAALSLYAIASAYLMTLIPLLLGEYGIDANNASWLASVFFAGLFVGTSAIKPVVKFIGHRMAFIVCLSLFIATIVVLPLAPVAWVWFIARFVGGIAVAGLFVVVESWLLAGDEASRAKRFGLYMCSITGGVALGQLGIGFVGIQGLIPFVVILSLLSAALVVMMFIPTQPPQSHNSATLSFRQISKLSHAAIIGCTVAGLIQSAIYGLMPLELTHRDVSQTHLSLLMALIIVGGMLVQAVIPLLIRVVGRTPLMGMFCLLGVFAIGLVILNSHHNVLAISLLLIGMASYALYPIAINLGCDKLDKSLIVSASQIMLFCYSLGSVIGPVIAGWFMESTQGLMTYLLAIMMATAIYMFIASIRTNKHAIAGE
ncbi:MFS transporter [Vibrio sp. SCSIO 43137]|uniref:MFS transporter n=1 Tax=Vibrio sp. SCSIO 43137 TaxID=3021011 RepID=UPI002307CBBD|nr:MFS transporter [Vibrio sp. SCSIO 43137]WCE32202.1 MFS transporter [Vibrio sp. SCSIO 43137]